MTAISVHELATWLKHGNRILIDLRDPVDQRQGMAEGAVAITVEALRKQVDDFRIHHDGIALMCYRGNLTGRLSQELGEDFVPVEGGFNAYIEAGLPVVTHRTDEQLMRYQQQIKLPGFGQVAQERLSAASVLVVGAGGLGAPGLLYLAGAGVGEITILDPDQVSVSNLHRQILYDSNQVGLNKAEQARIRLQALNPNVQVHSHNEAFTTENCEAHVQRVDLVLDGSDNLTTRLLINDTCNQLCKPWVFAGVNEFEWQVAVFRPGEPCYRCVFPDLREDSDVANCTQAGVLGPVPGMAAMIQVTEAIKLLAGLPGGLKMELLHHDLLNHRHKVLKYGPTKNCEHQSS